MTPRDAVVALDARGRRAQAHPPVAGPGRVGRRGGAVPRRLRQRSSQAPGPGDALYGLRTMIFGEQPATRDDRVVLASQQLAEVQQLIDEGQWDAAQDKLQTLTTTVATVNDVEQQAGTGHQWQELTVKVDAQDAAATLPPDAPPPVLPDAGRRCTGHRHGDRARPHVVGDAARRSLSSSSETTPPLETSPFAVDTTTTTCRRRDRRRLTAAADEWHADDDHDVAAARRTTTRDDDNDRLTRPRRRPPQRTTAARPPGRLRCRRPTAAPPPSAVPSRQAPRRRRR